MRLIDQTASDIEAVLVVARAGVADIEAGRYVTIAVDVVVEILGLAHDRMVPSAASRRLLRNATHLLS